VVTRVSAVAFFSPEERIAVNSATPSLFIRFGAAELPAALPAPEIVYAPEEAAQGGPGGVAHPNSESRIP